MEDRPLLGSTPPNLENRASFQTPMSAFTFRGPGHHPPPEEIWAVPPPGSRTPPAPDVPSGLFLMRGKSRDFFPRGGVVSFCPGDPYPLRICHLFFLFFPFVKQIRENREEARRVVRLVGGRALSNCFFSLFALFFFSLRSPPFKSLFSCLLGGASKTELLGTPSFPAYAYFLDLAFDLFAEGARRFGSLSVRDGCPFSIFPHKPPFFLLASSFLLARSPAGLVARILFLFADGFVPPAFQD